MKVTLTLVLADPASDILPQRAKELMAQEEEDMNTEIPPVPSLPDDESENMDCERNFETGEAVEDISGQVNGIKPRT